jgi:hypothetical protein
VPLVQLFVDVEARLAQEERLRAERGESFAAVIREQALIFQSCANTPT